MFTLVAGIELGCAVGILWAAWKLRTWALIQEKEDARIQKEWGAVADKYEELAKHAEELAKGATELEERERRRVMSKGYAEIYDGSKPDPGEVN
jgi:hypothetical protein